jgi:FtsH-binding integral membrane protein
MSSSSSTWRNLITELQFGRLEKDVKSHLQKVYTTMGLALIACAIGSYIHMANIFTAGILTILGTLGASLGIFLMAPTAENQPKRFALFMLLGALCGINQGPLLQIVATIDPSIVMTALLATALIFVCFSICALLSEERKWLAIGGVLMSALSCLLLFGLMNIFFRSELLYEVQLYLGLVVFCGFVLYDTQLIVEKRRRGDDDYIGHCVLLFLDFINIFRHLLILLANKEVKREKRRKDD